LVFAGKRKGAGARGRSKEKIGGQKKNLKWQPAKSREGEKQAENINFSQREKGKRN